MPARDRTAAENTVLRARISALSAASLCISASLDPETVVEKAGGEAFTDEDEIALDRLPLARALSGPETVRAEEVTNGAGSAWPGAR